MTIRLFLSTVLLTFLVGVVAWATRPTEKTFSWVELSEQDYLVGYLELAAAEWGPAHLRMGDYTSALSSLHASVSGEYFAYAALGTMGGRLELQTGESYPLFHEAYVSENYFQGRSMTVSFGRLFSPDEQDAFVIGNGLARQVFGNPAAAVDQVVTLKEAGASENGRSVRIVGVLAPSPAQDPDQDNDYAVTGSLAAKLALRPSLATMPLALQVRLASTRSEDLVSSIEAWVGTAFGSDGKLRLVNELSTERQTYVREMKPRIEARRRTFALLGSALSLGALLALYAQSYWYLLRQRQRLGVDKALGATRQHLLFRLLGSQLPWGALGSVVGGVALWSLYELIPGVFLTRPPAPILGLAISVPQFALFALALLVGLSILRTSSMQLLRGKVEGSRVRPLLVLVYGGLAIALASGLAATRVDKDVTTEARALAAQFGLMYSLQAGNPVLDPRSERAFEGSEFAPVFTSSDAAALAQLSGVEATSLAQTVPQLSMSLDGNQASAMAVAADEGYLAFMGFRLSSGDSTACMLSPQVADALGAELGDEIALSGLTGPVPCRVSGLLAPQDALWSWLVADLPDVITPPLDGIGLALPDNTATPFSSTRVLLRLASSDVEDPLKAWLAAVHPGVRAEIVPTTPDVEGLMVGLKLQARLFSLIAALAVVLCVWGVVGGFFALLDAERFKTALDRALGLSLDGLTRRWWNQMMAWSTASATLGIAGGFITAQSLYDALALDIPNLPRPEYLALDLRSVVMVVIFLVVLSSLLSLTGRRWVAQQSALQQLKEGAL